MFLSSRSVAPKSTADSMSQIPQHKDCGHLLEINIYPSFDAGKREQLLD